MKNLMSLFCLFVGALLVTMPAFAQIESGSTYLFVHKKSGKALSNFNSANRDAFIALDDANGEDAAQQWTLIPSNEERKTFNLHNYNYSMSIDMALSSSHKKLLQWDCELSNENQQFLIKEVEASTNTYQLLTRDGTLALTPNDDGDLQMTIGEDIENTFFVLTNLHKDKIYPGGFYTLKSYAYPQFFVSTGGKTANNSVLETKVLSEEDTEKWEVRKGSTGFLFTSCASGRAIDMAVSSTNRPLQWSAIATNENQNFTIRPVEGLDHVYQLYVVSNKQTFYLCVDYNGNVDRTKDASQINTYFVITPTNAQAFKGLEWQNEKIFGENKLKGHATYIPYATTAEMKADKQHYDKPWLNNNSSLYRSLNGIWSLIWKEGTDDMPEEEFYGNNVDASSWDTISVPSCLEMKGYGYPYYINENYPFRDEAPYIMMHANCKNSVASYRRNFEIPSSWGNKEIFLHFDGVYSCAYVWVNGQYVGYTQGSNNDAEFDITKFAKIGANNVSVRVIRFSDGSYLEGQDMWRMSGIHRDVFVYATPKTFIRDHYITSELNSQKNYQSGSLSVRVEVQNTEKTALSRSVEARIITPDGVELASQSKDFAFNEGDSIAIDTIVFNELNHLELWSDETPKLYTVELSLLNEGSEEMAFATKHGFRSIEMKSANGGKAVFINGKRIYFKGVNTQDTHPLYGRSIDVPTMLKDIQLMKQANINTVRCSHYPRQNKMYAMFDYYGMYVMDEADLECHYNWYYGGQTITNSASWRPAYIDREERMVLAHRNFPSIIFWSLGNESGGGSNFPYCYQAIKQLDSRFIHYEGASRQGTSGSTDISSEMYPTVSEVSNNCSKGYRNQPYFICEYAHAMGNAVGNLQEYWDGIFDSNYGLGGCIWDWVDQSIYDAADIKAGTLVVEGRPKYKTGYDYPNTNSQGNFVNNGLVNANREWTPELTEVKKVFQNVKMTNFIPSTRRVTLTNNFSYTTLNEFDLNFAILVNGDTIETGTMTAPPIKPGKTGTFAINYKSAIPNDKECTLRFDLVDPNGKDWCEAGHSIATFERVLTERPAKVITQVVPQNGEKVRIVPTSSTTYDIYAGKTTIRVNSSSIESWKYNDNTTFETLPEFDCYAFVENFKSTSAIDNGIDTKTLSLSANSDSTEVYLDIVADGYRCMYDLRYTIYANGIVDMQATFMPMVNDLRRIGLYWKFPQSYENVTYYGRGPWENYPDRKTGSYLGRYTTTVSDMFEPYAQPQTCGGRQDVRDVAITDNSGNGYHIIVEGTAAMQMLHYDDYTMARARHNYDITPNGTYVHFDAAVQGVGNGSCGQGTGTLNKYKCPSSGTLSYTLRFAPIENNQEVTNIKSAQKKSLNENKIYDLSGRQVKDTAKGDIYIVNGKKVIR